MSLESIEANPGGPRHRFLILLAIIPLSVPACDALFHGPYARWAHGRYTDKAMEAGLVGKPVQEVVRVLGEPHNIAYLPSEQITTYNYSPIWYFPGSHFQVHCRGGIAVRIEPFQD